MPVHITQPLIPVTGRVTTRASPIRQRQRSLAVQPLPEVWQSVVILYRQPILRITDQLQPLGVTPWRIRVFRREHNRLRCKWSSPRPQHSWIMLATFQIRRALPVLPMFIRACLIFPSEVKSQGWVLPVENRAVPTRWRTKVLAVKLREKQIAVRPFSTHIMATLQEHSPTEPRKPGNLMLVPPTTFGEPKIVGAHFTSVLWAPPTPVTGRIGTTPTSSKKAFNCILSKGKVGLLTQACLPFFVFFK